MKKVFLAVFLIIQFAATAQRSAIFFEDPAKFPAGLAQVKSWLVGMTSQLPFVFKNAKTSPNQSATFQQFSLAFNEERMIPIGDSGNFFSLASADGKPVKMNVQYEGQWKISAYQPNFNLNLFKPSDLVAIFQNSLLIYNISEEQALAQFLNKYAVSDKLAPLQTFVRDAEKLTKKKFDIKDLDNASLKTIVQAMYGKTNRYASDIAYQMYLKDKNHAKEAANVAGFFDKYTDGNAIEDFLDTATPQGKFYFEKSGVSLVLDKKMFLIPETGNAVALKTGFQFLSHKIKYDKQDKPYMSLKFESLKPENALQEFQLANEYELNKNKFNLFPFKGRQTFKAENLQEIELRLYDEGFQVFTTLKIDNYTSVYCIGEGKISYK